MKVTGLQPHSVRIALEPGELPVLVDELLHGINAHSGALLEASPAARHDSERLRDASSWLLEYRNLLSQVAEEERPKGEAVVVVMPMAVAHELVPACCEEAIERLRTAVAARDDRNALSELADAVRQWVQTLVDLRYLDEEGPDYSVAL
jgi:hypothetical protein